MKHYEREAMERRRDEIEAKYSTLTGATLEERDEAEGLCRELSDSERTYTCQEEGKPDAVYYGFDRTFELHCGELIGIARVEGRIETWALDKRSASRELVRYYEEQYGYLGVRVMNSEIAGWHSNPAVSDKMTHPAVN